MNRVSWGSDATDNAEPYFDGFPMWERGRLIIGHTEVADRAAGYSSDEIDPSPAYVAAIEGLIQAMDLFPQLKLDIGSQMRRGLW